MPCCLAYFYLPEQVGILSSVLHVHWPQKREAYVLQMKLNSLINNVGKIKAVNHVHLRNILGIIIALKLSKINRKIILLQRCNLLLKKRKYTFPFFYIYSSQLCQTFCTSSLSSSISISLLINKISFSSDRVTVVCGICSISAEAKK